MRDYEESVRKLREYAEWMGPNNYELPITMYDDLLEAADAIEELVSNVYKLAGWSRMEHER